MRLLHVVAVVAADVAVAVVVGVVAVDGGDVERLLLQQQNSPRVM